MLELDKNYEASEYEADIYQKWVDSGYFNPDNLIEAGLVSNDEKAEPFTIVLPPPNVTGTLHVGHALGVTIQDILIRYHRMKGRTTLWLPGTDHAAIATQSKVEKILEKEESFFQEYAKEHTLALIRQTVEQFGIKYNSWFSESILHANNGIDQIVHQLKQADLIYEHENALWFKSTLFGDV